MQVKWRNKEYEFTPRCITATKDKTRESDIGANIYAFDTETMNHPDRCEPQTFQISNATSGESLVYLPPFAKGLEIFLDYFVKHFSWIEFENRICFMFAHNLMFDWLQLIKYYPDLIAMAKTGIGLDKDYEIYKKDYYCILKKSALFTGSAPHFTLKVGFSKREFVYIKFRDTFSFFPSSLAKLGAQLNLPVIKLKPPENLGSIDYREQGPSEDKNAFEEYGKRDPLVTRLVAEQIRELHIDAQMQRMRVSAPGFAINYLYHTIPEGTKLMTGIGNQEIMQLVLDTYAGGRTGGIYHGRVENISVLDFRSSYPASMVSLPSFLPTMDYLRHPTPEELTQEDLLEIIEECHCFMRVSGIETDTKYPCILTTKNNKLTPVFGEFENMPTTGVEIYVGIKSGTLTITKIHDLVFLAEMEEPAIYPFREYATKAYIRKSVSVSGSTEYTSAKLVMNGGYGKLIESRRTTTVDDDVKEYILPYPKEMEVEFGTMYYGEYIKTLNIDSDKTWKELYPELVKEVMDNFEESDILTASFEKLSLTKLKYGRYAIPAAASLITATSRARLLAVIKVTNGLYWDTDSIFIIDYNPNSIDWDLANTYLPKYITPVKVGPDLGDLDCEIENASGYLAGTKRYYIDTEIHRTCEHVQNCNEDRKNNCPNKKQCKVKRAVHGIPTAPFDKAEEMIKKLATGENNIYVGKQRPISVKQSKNVQEIGRFESKQYESQFHLDDRLQWEECNGGWKGKVKDYV